METSGKVGLTGRLSVKVFRIPKAPLMWRIKNALRWNYIKGLIGVFFVEPIANRFGLLTAHGELRIVHIQTDGSRTDYGVVSRHVVTNAFVNFLVDQLQAESSVIGDFKYHDSGVGATAENVTDTAIQTTDGESRVAGTQAEASANVYQSVATITYTTLKSITEHGLFNDPTAGTLMDRSVFGVVTMNPGESIQYTYTLTVNSGG